AGVYGLSVWDNTVKVTFKSGAQGTTPEIIKIVPKIDGFVFENHLVARKNCGDSAYFYGMPYDNKRLIFGAIEANKDSFTVKTDISNPPLAAAKALSGYLTEKGIKTYGVKTNSKPPLTPPQGENANSTLRGAGGLRTLHIYFSPPLSAIIKSTNHHSNNSFAEHILKYLSIDEKNQQGTLARSLDVVKKFWASKGLDVSTFFIQDGSGLSPHSAISAKFVNDVLIYMANESKNRAVFLESLPTAGKSGTVKNFLKDTPLQGKAFLKSGSIARVQCYAGYIIDDERSYAITILVNNFSGKRKDVVKEIEQMILRNFYARR
ncbi:MAG: D-alanyl-D-alanine carboxypeptidase, partial [Prevotellaceae bacterium]|nr:D-alanyl-D-alanine carboxypeptidase [Prevotellaceae bacterium]